MDKRRDIPVHRLNVAAKPVKNTTIASDLEAPSSGDRVLPNGILQPAAGETR
jgi:hypothetical protein